MTMTYAYKLTSEEIHIYFDIDLSTGFMQFMDAPTGLDSPMLGAVEFQVRLETESHAVIIVYLPFR